MVASGLAACFKAAANVGMNTPADFGPASGVPGCDSWSQEEDGRVRNGAFVTRGPVPLSSWQALLPSCGVQGGGRVRGGQQGEGTLQPMCPPSLDASAGECQPWRIYVTLPPMELDYF